MTQPTCETCRFWQLVELAPYWSGDCRRHTPRMQGDIAPHGSAQFQEPKAAIWPSTNSGDWCGEHQPKQEAPHDHD